MTKEKKTEEKKSLPVELSGDTEGAGAMFACFILAFFLITLVLPVERYINAQTKLTCARLHQIEPNTICKYGHGKMKFSPLKNGRAKGG